MKTNRWNVHKWDGKDHIYLGTIAADKEEQAVDAFHLRYGPGKYTLYPHIDNETVNGGGTYER